MKVERAKGQAAAIRSSLVMRLLLLPIAVLALLCAAPSAFADEGGSVVDTSIDSGPAEGATIEENPVFTFSATLDGAPLPLARFQCTVDGEAAEECTSPVKLRLEEGRHEFSVFAEDPASLIADPTPARRSFSVVEEEDEECEGGEAFEDEEAEEEECEGGEGERRRHKPKGAKGGPPPRECLLRSARAHLLVSSMREEVRLFVHYTSYSPADVDVVFALQGKGARRIGEIGTHFSKQGLFRATAIPGAAAMARIRAAHGFSVELKVPSAPPSCHRFQTRHLSVRHSLHGQTAWLQSGSVFGS
jgi:hypothetical protein